MILYSKRITVLLSFIVFAFSACTGSGYMGRLNPGFEHFRIYIEQDGIPQEIRDNRVNLQKRPFEIIVHFAKPDSIFVNASFSDESFQAALEGRPHPEIPGFQEPGMVEELFNRDETLMIVDTAPHYWHYSDRYDHRFSEVIFADAYLICKKKISYLTIGEKKEKPVEIENIHEDTIYLVFMKLEWTRDFAEKVEYKRTVLEINFE